jgi:hypothetical protein
LVANFTGTAVLVRTGTRLGTFTPQDPEDFFTLAVGAQDPAFRKELQEAVDAAGAADTRADAELAPMYFDQLAGQATGETPNELPKELNLSSPLLNSMEEGQLREMLQRYSKYIKDGEDVPSAVRDFEFPIDLTDGAEPQRMRTRRYPPATREEAVKQTKAMLKNGVVRPASTSSWSASVVLVPKKNGKLRYCVDYTALNRVTKPLAYDLPRVDDFLDSLGGAKYFTSIDMMSGY